MQNEILTLKAKRLEMKYIEIIFLIEFVLIHLTMWYAIVVSYFENERIAAFKLLIFNLLLSTIFLAVIFIPFAYSEAIQLFILCTSGIFSLVVFFPLPYASEAAQQPDSRFDERDVMFSRFKLTPDSETFNTYYSDKPDKLVSDNKTRKEAGLLSSDAKYFHPYLFSAAKANFFAVDSLAPSISGSVAEKQQHTSPEDISKYILNWTKELGAHSVGITSLHEKHYYTHKGRGEKYGKKITSKHKYAIAFTVEMDVDNVAAAPAASIVYESSKQYLQAGNLAVQIAAFIRNLGYDAQAHIDGNYEVICPLVARDAGLGEIGRMGLLMDEKLGPRCRIGVITTDLPLICNDYTPNISIIRFCEMCKKCASTCPGKAITKENRKGNEGAKRWTIDHEACFHFWCIAGTDCGRCMAVCPYSHHNNFLHNFIRWGIGNSSIFARVALLLDNLLYGEKPSPKKLPKWVN